MEEVCRVIRYNQINLLSAPRIVTKSGSIASIQVGTDVPIITSQRAASTQVGGTSDILQTVDYRETGILLDVEPLVLSKDRIDLKISQEVSAAQANANQSIGSPVISNRKITSELTLRDGQTAVLGGLIEDSFTRGVTGIPFLKDLPVLGRAFSTETLNKNSTVLLFMITPFILDTENDQARASEIMSNEVNIAFKNGRALTTTVYKDDQSMQVYPVTRGSDVP